MAFLADRCDGRPTQARHVAEHLGVPTDSALKVLQALARHRLLRSRLGRSGGYTLDLPAGGVSLLQIVEAIDGPIRMDVPVEPHDAGLTPPLELLRQVCERSAVHLRNHLAGLTVADLAAASQPPTALAAAG